MSERAVQKCLVSGTTTEGGKEICPECTASPNRMKAQREQNGKNEPWASRGGPLSLTFSVVWP